MDRAKRVMGFEPTTSSLASWRSTAELHPQIGGGFTLHGWPALHNNLGGLGGLPTRAAIIAVQMACAKPAYTPHRAHDATRGLGWLPMERD